MTSDTIIFIIFIILSSFICISISFISYITKELDNLKKHIVKIINIFQDINNSNKELIDINRNLIRTKISNKQNN